MKTVADHEVLYEALTGLGVVPLLRPEEPGEWQETS